MIYEEIRCDGCGATGAITTTEELRERAWMARKRLTGYGWRCGIPGGLDYCPGCWAKIQRGEGAWA